MKDNHLEHDHDLGGPNAAHNDEGQPGFAFESDRDAVGEGTEAGRTGGGFGVETDFGTGSPDVAPASPGAGFGVETDFGTGSPDVAPSGPGAGFGVETEWQDQADRGDDADDPVGERPSRHDEEMGRETMTGEARFADVRGTPGLPVPPAPIPGRASPGLGRTTGPTPGTSGTDGQ